MRYHYERPKLYFNEYGKTYKCNHVVYSECTLYVIGNRGLAVIQQRYDKKTKSTYWTAIDPWLVDELYFREGFLTYFKKYAKEADGHGLYPTVTIRQIMWKLRFKPMKREQWETCFDKSPI